MRPLNTLTPFTATAAALAAALTTLPALAQELRVQCYSDGNECEVTGEIAKRFEAANAGAKIVIDKVPYKAVVETLPVQLAAGEGPDVARVADLGGLNTGQAKAAAGTGIPSHPAPRLAFAAFGLKTAAT